MLKFAALTVLSFALIACSDNEEPTAIPTCTSECVSLACGTVTPDGVQDAEACTCGLADGSTIACRAQIGCPALLPRCGMAPAEKDYATQNEWRDAAIQWMTCVRFVAGEVPSP